MYVRAGRPAFARPCVGVHKSTSLKYKDKYMKTNNQKGLGSVLVV